MGSYYEQKGSQVTKYYFAGTSRIAMRKYTIPQNMTVEYFLTDHLGSTSLVTDADGAKVSEMRYKPWGEVRYNAGTMPTNYTYTGQYSYTSDFGLMFYNARWYDPSLGRFAQADTIVPGGVQGWDRYAYVNNAPTRFTDPSGHLPIDDECGYQGQDCGSPLPTQLSTISGGGGGFNGNNGGGQQPTGFPSPQNLSPTSEPLSDEGWDSCYQHISDNYWANICGGGVGSEFTHIFFTNPGHEGYWLGVNYDSPSKTFAEALISILMELLPAPPVRAPWKVDIVTGTQMGADALLGVASSGDAWDDTLGGAISNAGDYGNGNVHLFIFQNVYNPVAISNRGQGPVVFAPSSRFVVIVQAEGKTSYLPIYISTLYQDDFNLYWRIP